MHISYPDEDYLSLPCIHVVETIPKNPYPVSSEIRICTALLLSRAVHRMDGWVGNEGKGVHEGSGMVGGIGTVVIAEVREVNGVTFPIILITLVFLSLK